MDPKVYIIGGYVRDKILKRKTKDKDYMMVLDNYDVSTSQGFKIMCEYLETHKIKIIKKYPEILTIKVKINKMNHDFTLARKDHMYAIDSRVPKITVSMFEDDIFRRDFNINALAIEIDIKNIHNDEDDKFNPENVIDLVKGVQDIKNKRIRTLNEARKSLLDDPLRILRGLRLSVTLDFELDESFFEALVNPEIWEKFSSKNVISNHRIIEELNKMLYHDTFKSMILIHKLNNYYKDASKLILGDIMIKATIKV